MNFCAKYAGGKLDFERAHGGPTATPATYSSSYRREGQRRSLGAFLARRIFTPWAWTIPFTNSTPPTPRSPRYATFALSEPEVVAGSGWLARRRGRNLSTPGDLARWDLALIAARCQPESYALLTAVRSLATKAHRVRLRLVDQIQGGRQVLSHNAR